MQVTANWISACPSRARGINWAFSTFALICTAAAAPRPLTRPVLLSRGIDAHAPGLALALHVTAGVRSLVQVGAFGGVHARPVLAAGCCRSVLAESLQQ